MSAGARPVCLAIATGRHLRPGETFVNRHIAELFDGRTVVIAGRRQERPPAGTPVFFRGRAALNLRDMLAAPVALARGRARYSTFRVPYGLHRHALEAFLREHGVEAILAEFGSQGPPVAPVGAALGIPVFCYFRGKDATEALRRPRRLAAYRAMFPQLSGVFTVSRFLLDTLAAQGLSHPNSHVVPSGVDTDAFAPAAKQPLMLLLVGRFVAKKSPQTTVAAFLRIAERYPGARLEMIGHGPLLPACRALVERAGMSDRIIFHGRQPHDFVRARMAAAEVFVQHSVTAADGEAEGLPSAIQEAMASGAAVVSTRHAGIPEAVEDGVTGYLAAEHDLDGFTQAIERVLADDAARRAMAARARVFALERFDYRRLYGRVEEVIREAVAGGDSA